MWSATLIVSQSRLAKPQTKFGVHWPRPGEQKKRRRELGGEAQKKKCVTTEWSLTTYNSSLAPAHPAYTPHSFTGMYMHTPGGWGTELDSVKPSFSLLFHLAAAARLPDRQTALAHPPFLCYRFSLPYPLSLKIHPLTAVPYNQVTDSHFDCAWAYALSMCLIKKTHVREWEKIRLWSYVNMRHHVRDRQTGKRMKGFNFCRWERDTKCSECDLMVMLRWGLGVQILLVTGVQTCYPNTYLHQCETTSKAPTLQESTHNAA